MIREYLEDHKKIDRLHSSYLINTDDAQKALVEIEQFLQKNLLDNNELVNSPDYMCVRRIDSKTKNIAVDQIRGLQSFLNKTSVISGQKIGVIYAADEMNLNSSNSCLKLLEEPPLNTHLFLITENASSIIPTIRSRCAKIKHFYHLQENSINNDEFLRPLLKSTRIKDRLDFVKKFVSKDRDLWSDFSRAVEAVIAKFGKNVIGITVDLTKVELELLGQLKNKSPLYIEQKYQDIKKIIDNTNKYDLDLRSNVVLLLEKMRY
jgi:DNA polymerase III subunit delta'